MAFNEKLAKKLKKILAKAGLDEDKIDEVVEEVEEATSEEVVEEDGNPEEAQVPPTEEEGGEVPPEVVEEVVNEEQPAPQEAPLEGEAPIEEVPPTDGSIEQALGELAAQEQGEVPQEVVAPTPDQAPLPPIDPTLVEELKTQLGEANKTIEGLTARIDSLEEALRSAGVISSDSKLGDETPRITPNANQESEDAFDEIINHINGKD